MSDKKISELTALTAPDGTEELVVNDSGTSKKITQTNLLSTALPLAGGTMTGTIAGFTSTGIDDNATSTAITIDSSENTIFNGELKLPAAGLLKTGSSGGAITLQGGATFGGGTIVLSGGNADGDIVFKAETGTATPAERMRIQSGGGISFNGDTAAANALDDYEEGSWTATLTPTTSGSITLSSAVGNYTKVGNVVHVTVYPKVGSVVSPVGLLSLGGLPFTSGAAANGGAGSVVPYSMAAGTHNVTLEGQSSSTAVYIWTWDNSVREGLSPYIQGGSQLHITYTYRV